MQAVAAPLFADLFASLPRQRQRRLEDQTLTYVRALDQSIAKILSPTVAKSEGQFLVTDELIPLEGAGATPQEAMADYRSVVVEWCESLEEEAHELAGPLRKQLALLQQVLSSAEQAT
ncbi:MAG: hypothetical protein COZ06_15150 [Armatimonadetes bacterium CG_4_10_14_3_um_filter_66_18]|nr:hypothetical protein [Armatimonadota bacterium]OIO94611.1 MAG: hypothetical protein AUJ96_28280 [Armatimonadetes bacterium CG2_30_66_41]PIU95096.1 MAG: hypothetical protein COS65_04260 [Armatimonadetes bacterium CG06_land_8_20_14_3_00_66_21]PIX41037.1 MAG: hypothetical protein COZ57_24505 [Armatimonadetes bacterium CG_4_8_14_3_um_filter_66_20]PIY48980.1 MAG: hypothetical protein COZ06_15150 [Armatimonadetes bacterium CG_4_10_14_3_um_filter_66_18]PIZ35161.1 MAG: hypothetical protein COY42_27